MGIRYHKSLKIAKGVKLNLSKSGVSLSLGGKGITSNFGHGRHSSTFSIPGTGLSYRTSHVVHKKVSSTKKKANVHYKNSLPTMPSKGIYTSSNMPSSVTIGLNQSGKVSIYSPEGYEILDTGLLRKIKSMPSYKAEKDRLERKRRELLTEEYNHAHLENSNIVNLHNYSPVIELKENIQKQLDSLKPRQQTPRKFSGKEPDKASIRGKLIEEAASQVSSIAFWKVKQLREQYVEENLPKRYNVLLEQYQSEKEKFENTERILTDELNAQYQLDYEAQKESLQRKLSRNPDDVTARIDNWISTCDLPIDVNLNYEYDSITGNIRASTSLPNEKAIPTIEVVKLKSGSIKEKAKTQQTLKQEYATMTFGYMIYLAANLFNASLNTEKILLSGFAKRRDKEGKLIKECLLSIVFVRKQFENHDLHYINPEEFCMQFENRCILSATKLFKAITPIDVISDLSSDE